jgi:hypothetical protein
VRGRAVKHHSSSSRDANEGGGGDNGDGNKSKESWVCAFNCLVMNWDI